MQRCHPPALPSHSRMTARGNHTGSDRGCRPLPCRPCARDGHPEITVTTRKISRAFHIAMLPGIRKPVTLIYSGGAVCVKADGFSGIWTILLTPGKWSAYLKKRVIRRNMFRTVRGLCSMLLPACFRKLSLYSHSLGWNDIFSQLQ